MTITITAFERSPDGGQGDLALFETGAIMLHVTQRHAGLLPDDAQARAAPARSPRNTRPEDA